MVLTRNENGESILYVFVNLACSISRAITCRVDICKVPCDAMWNVAKTETLASPCTVHCDHATSNAPIFWLICCNRPVEIK